MVALDVVVVAAVVVARAVGGRVGDVDQEARRRGPVELHDVAQARGDVLGAVAAAVRTHAADGAAEALDVGIEDDRRVAAVAVESVAVEDGSHAELEGLVRDLHGA